MRPIITHFTDDDLYKFTMCCAVIENYPRTRVKYRFFDRNNTVYPPGFAEELMRQIALLEEVVITDEDILLRVDKMDKNRIEQIYIKLPANMIQREAEA